MTLPRNKQQPPRKPKGPNGVAGLLKGMISPSGGDDSIGLIDLAAVAIISILATYFATNYFGAKVPAVPVSFYVISGSNFRCGYTRNISAAQRSLSLGRALAVR